MCHVSGMRWSEDRSRLSCLDSCLLHTWHHCSGSFPCSRWHVLSVFVHLSLAASTLVCPGVPSIHDHPPKRSVRRRSTRVFGLPTLRTASADAFRRTRAKLDVHVRPGAHLRRLHLLPRRPSLRRTWPGPHTWHHLDTFVDLGTSGARSARHGRVRRIRGRGSATANARKRGFRRVARFALASSARLESRMRAPRASPAPPSPSAGPWNRPWRHAHVTKRRRMRNGPKRQAVWWDRLG
mmetsp:Transcript_4691/g.29589  ORF Transcript_4691/g.29589 Transcript_4691/m.29589 type:complete len:238 (-) Transcript_4691:1360-2073(-)